MVQKESKAATIFVKELCISIGHPFYNQPKIYHKRDGLKFCPFDMAFIGASYKQLPFDAGGLAAKT